MSRNISKLKKNLVALEVGSSGIKLVIGDFVREDLVVKQVLINPLPHHAYTDGEIADLDIVTDTLKQTLKNNKIRARNCFCIMNSGQIISREVTVPNQNKEHVEEMAKYEVEQFLPVEMENYVVESIVIREMEVDDKPFADMLVTAFPKKLVDQMFAIVMRAGLTPVVLDTQTNAFNKLIEHQFSINGNDYHKESVCAFIDLGYESINVQIFKKGVFGFSQIIPFGGRDIDTNISKMLEITPEEAAMMKMKIRNLNYPVDNQTDEGQLLDIIKTTFSNWFIEIDKVFRFYRSRSSSANNVEYIYIYGGLSNMPGLTDYIESQYHIPTERIRKISSVIFKSDVDISECLNTLGVFYRR